jgi:hypothetical protein
MGEEVRLRAIGSRADERPRRWRGPALAAKQTKCGVFRPSQEGESENPDAPPDATLALSGKAFFFDAYQKK